jgi:hypothetical protein
MWLIVLEAMAALAVLVFVVWWTMFSGRRGGEMPPEEGDASPLQGQDDEAARGGNKKLKG